MQRLARKCFAFLGGLAALTLAAVAPLHPQPAGNLPPGDGRDLLTAACTQCHGLGTITAMRDGAAGWKLHVYNMVFRGARLSEPEIDTVIQYLAANFGPTSPRPPGGSATPVALPGGTGKDLVEVRCALCHDLDRVVAVRRKTSDWDAIIADMIKRGATATPDEARTISAYLAAQFGSN